MTAKKTAKKKSVRRAPRKKAAKKAAKKADPKLSSEPKDGKIVGELKYKLKALDLELAQENQRVEGALQPRIYEIVMRTKRNDMKWKKARDARVAAINEFIDKKTPSLPAGYAITTVNPVDGTYRAVYDPDLRGVHLQ